MKSSDWMLRALQYEQMTQLAENKDQWDLFNRLAAAYYSLAELERWIDGTIDFTLAKEQQKAA
jgi:hypothetical protein